MAAWSQTLWVCQTILLHHMLSYRIIPLLSYTNESMRFYESINVYDIHFQRRPSKSLPCPRISIRGHNVRGFPILRGLSCDILICYGLDCAVPDVAVCKSVQEDYHQLCGPQMSSWQNAVKAYGSCIDSIQLCSFNFQQGSPRHNGHCSHR